MELRAANLIRVRVVFAGHVQGVSFRATCVELARGYTVTGFVRNLPDGAVELEAQGLGSHVDGLIAAIETRFARNITHVQKTDTPPRADEASFRITS